MEGNKDNITNVLERVRDFCSFGERDKLLQSYIIIGDENSRGMQPANTEKYIALFENPINKKHSDLITLFINKEENTIEGRFKIYSKIIHLKLPKELEGIEGTVSKDERIAQEIASSLKGWPHTVISFSKKYNEEPNQNQKDKEVIVLYTLSSIPPEEAFKEIQNRVIKRLAK